MPQERPFDILSKSTGNQVLIRLKGGMAVRGTLMSFDAHMNVVLENSEELSDGELKAKLGTILLRGGNIIYVSPVSS